ncbi:YggS family pyridoxal phosphate-dependent enzyme [Legionella sp. CNM-4043-24]|uniref:YggS family pyridoxal phosphate-dependent enzyme n=1 Tax=Legionella sp. CNM-4043-24 TaxID=3421646 RepID=UPI00403AE066
MSIINNIQRIQQSIRIAAQHSQRKEGDISLLAVSKGQPSSVIRSAYAAGLRQFGENYWQEVQGKQNELYDLSIIWHFIGPIQSNKAADIARHMDWVHSVDREKIARLLSAHRPENLPPLNICLSINLDNEPAKSGVPPEQAADLLKHIQSLPNLAVRGLMAIPKPRQDRNAQYESLLRLRNLQNELNESLHLNMDTLSMGMSDDLEAAIRAGSTIVRVGRAIFGERS